MANTTGNRHKVIKLDNNINKIIIINNNKLIPKRITTNISCQLKLITSTTLPSTISTTDTGEFNLSSQIWKEMQSTITKTTISMTSKRRKTFTIDIIQKTKLKKNKLEYWVEMHRYRLFSFLIVKVIFFRYLCWCSGNCFKS